MTLDVQDNRCPICGRNFTLWTKRAAVADHDHTTNEFRGVICGGKTGCNLSLVGRYEQGHTKNLTSEAITAVAAYLADPPALRLRPSFLTEL